MGNLAGPGRKRRPRLVLMKLIPEDHVGVLENVFGINRPGHQRQDVKIQLPLMSAQQRGELVHPPGIWALVGWLATHTQLICARRKVCLEKCLDFRESGVPIPMILRTRRICRRPRPIGWVRGRRRSRFFATPVPPYADYAPTFSARTSGWHSGRRSCGSGGNTDRKASGPQNRRCGASASRNPSHGCRSAWEYPA